MSSDGVIVGLMTAIIVFFLVVNSFQALLLMFAVPEIWSHWQLADDEYFHALVGTEALPPISIVATLHNAERDVAAQAHMLLDLDYPRHEVVLVNDNVDDGTLGLLIGEFELYEVPPAFTVSLRTRPVRAYYRSRTHPRLLCIDKEPGGHGDAINAGLNASRYPHALAIGHDVVFEPDALLRLTRPFLLDRSVAAVGGTLRPANGSYLENGRLVSGPVRGWTLGCQTIEYMRNFLFQRLGWNRMASNLIFPGNTVLFKREHIFAVGGFGPDVALPGVDLDIRLRRHLTDKGINPRMPVIPDQIAWASVPEDIGTVARARRNWQRGLVRSLSGTSSMFGNPEFGAFGMLAIPYFWIAIVIAPFIELLGYAGLVIGVAVGALDAPFVVAYLAAVVGYGILLSVWTVILQALTFQRSARPREIGRLLFYAVVESLGYRQLMAVYRVSAHLTDNPDKHFTNVLKPPDKMDNHRLQALHDAGQSIWLDYIDRTILHNGDLERRLTDDVLTGMTSNPTIFEKALAEGTAYDDELRSAPHNLTAGEMFELVETDDVRAACDIFANVYNSTGGKDGFVSIEVSPGVSHNADATVEEALRLWKTVNRPNVMVKVPGTEEGAKAVYQLTTEGVNVNITLLFAVSAYERVADAYINALEERVKQGKPIERIASVASFFVSRVDTEVDKRLQAIGGEATKLEGKAAIANAKMAYQLFLKKFSGPRWDALKAKGARVQRPLWASTSTKNPAYSDVMYVEQLIGPDTVNTMPPKTIDAFRDHGIVARTVDANVDQARAELDALQRVQVDMHDVTDVLLREGIASFEKSFQTLLAGIQKKLSELRTSAA